MKVTTARERAVEGRNDLSRFVVHLTRDDRKDDPEWGQTAPDNFKDIMDSKTILALRPHCLHGKQIPKKHRDKFLVCCFTEVPLHELHLVTRPIQGRRNQYSDYGFVFSREFLVSKGAQPAIYVNSYDRNMDLQEATVKVYEIAEKTGFRSKRPRR